MSTVVTGLQYSALECIYKDVLGREGNTSVGEAALGGVKTCPQDLYLWLL